MDDLLATYGIEAGRFQRVSFPGGEVIFREGDRAEHAFLIESGVVEIFKTGAGGDPATIALLKRGALFGEMALIGKKPRSASAKAITETACYVMEMAQFNALMQTLEPFPRLVLRQLLHALYRLTNIHMQER